MSRSCAGQGEPKFKVIQTQLHFFSRFLEHYNAINTTPPAIAPSAFIHKPGAPVCAAPALLVLVFFVDDAACELDDVDDDLELDPELDPELDLDWLVVKLELRLDLLFARLPELDDVARLDKWIVVDNPLTTTSVIPLMIVVRPDTEKLGFNGIVVKPPVRISSVVPDTKLRLPMDGASVGASNVVAPDITKNGVPFIVDVDPLKPDGAKES